MTRVKLGGRELVIAEADLTEYLAMGYSVIDGKGNELSRGKAVSYEQAIGENIDLRERLKKMSKDLEELHTRNAEFKALSQENESLKAQLTQAQSDLEAANRKYTTLEASIKAKPNKSSSDNKSPGNEDLGLKTAT